MNEQDKSECGWINAEIDRMNAELEGGDWCCGGGDERLDHLMTRLNQLGGKRDPGKYGWHGHPDQKEK